MRLVLAEPRARLRIVGEARPDLDADYPDELHARAMSLGIGDAVEFVGAVPLVDQQLAGADVVLHVADRESFGNVLVEALLRGIPSSPLRSAARRSFATASMACWWTLPTDRPRPEPAWSDRDPARRNAMGAAGRARALELFDDRRTAAETWQLVADVTRTRPAVIGRLVHRCGGRARFDVPLTMKPLCADSRL